MSKSFPRFTCIFIVFLICTVAAQSSASQTFEAEIAIDANRSIASVHGRFLSGPDFIHVNLSFLASIAGHRDIAQRIKGVEIFDASGAPAPFRKLIDSEYLAQAGVFSWKYEVDLTPLKDSSAAAHTSWISGNTGLLMLGDILPTGERSGKLKLRLPADWSVFTTENVEPGNVIEIRDASLAVLAIGTEWQVVQLREAKINIDVVTTGRWNFTPTEAAAMCREISLLLKSVVGDDGDRRRQVILSNFPMTTSAGQWEAETRGDTVSIISSDMPFRTQSLQRLHEQLRHELFHLWIPNGVNLTGNYDWFYEGFALYESLKLAVGLNRIRFEDFLDTLSRAHTIDTAQSERISLIHASNTRFGGSPTNLYARGMLVAFLTDLGMLEQSKGKRSVENVLRELYAKHRKPARPAEGNAAVLELLKSDPRMISLVDRYVTGADKIEWANDLAAFGIEDGDAGPVTSLRVKEKLNGRQKTLLDKLGYNNWRKLSPTSK